MQLYFSLPLYLLFSCGVAFVALKLATIVDNISKHTKISTALIGGILLAAVTSLPELITSITSTLMTGSTDAVFGNILGSNLFDIVIFGIILLIFFRSFYTSKMGKYHKFSFLFCFILYITVSIGLYTNLIPGANNILQFGFFNIISLAILVIYILSVILTPSQSEVAGEESVENVDKVEEKKLVKKYFIHFGLYALALVGLSIFLTYFAEEVAGKNGLNLDPVVAGAIFLAIATSLPELISSLSLAYKKNFDASLSNIVGSCVFNFSILFVADILSFSNSNIYSFSVASSFLIICGVIAAIVLCAIVMLKPRLEKSKNHHHFFSILTGALILLTYAFYFIAINIF